ncbi:MAG: AAA family ATPase [Velocimicrobium sp.]
MLRNLPIGNDQFQKIREKNAYYADKTLMIKDFIEFQDEVALITRPPHFGKTLNMTMLREFFDITKQSETIFEGLSIMKTEYKDMINTVPVIYFSFKDCCGVKEETLRKMLARELLKEYEHYNKIFDDKLDRNNVYVEIFNRIFVQLKDGTIQFDDLAISMEHLIHMVAEYYQIRPILLIDEYDQPMITSSEHGYYKTLKEFFSIFYGSVLKGNKFLEQALLVGIQQRVKDNILLKLNNVQIYTMSDKKYSSYFGLSEEEARELLTYYGLEFNEEEPEMYEDSLFLGIQRYNPWSVIQYAIKNKPITTVSI